MFNILSKWATCPDVHLYSFKTFIILSWYLIAIQFWAYSSQKRPSNFVAFIGKFTWSEQFRSLNRSPTTNNCIPMFVLIEHILYCRRLLRFRQSFFVRWCKRFSKTVLMEFISLMGLLSFGSEVFWSWKTFAFLIKMKRYFSYENQEPVVLQLQANSISESIDDLIVQMINWYEPFNEKLAPKTFVKKNENQWMKNSIKKSEGEN